MNPLGAYCIIIPCYNHGSALAATFPRIAQTQLSVIIVDDAGNETSAGELRKIAAEFPHQVTLLRHAQNQGKGGAVITAIRYAAKHKFTHALQIDADGQHDLGAIPEFLAASRRQPDALVSGQPIYDKTVPRVRRYGRYITHFFVWLETLSFRLKDSMCGLRVYPLAATEKIFEKHTLGRRMDFDSEIMVRLFRQNTPVRFIPVKVTYPAGGTSHFHAFDDNVRISRMHTRLMLTLPFAAPALIAGRFRRQQHWASASERRGLLGMRFMLQVYSLLGRPVFNALLIPVITAYWLTARHQRRASKQFLRQIKIYADAAGTPLSEKLTTHRHFLRFGHATLDKLAAWRGDIRCDNVEIHISPQVNDLVREKKGAVILGSHLGNFELCRALGTGTGQIINAIVYTKHAQRFNRLLRETAPDSQLNIIDAASLDAAGAIQLKEKIDAGEWVSITADRTAVAGMRNITADFLGKPAKFPQGPFILAAALRCPVFLIFAINENKTRKLYAELFADPLLLPRKNRAEALQTIARQYADRLAHYCLKAPLDWFNFYDFWK